VCHPDVVATVTWDAEIAEVYDETVSHMFEPDVVEPAVDRLVELAAGGAALEFAIGTGRLALPLAQRGVHVHGIELSRPMLEQFRAKSGAAAIDVAIGNMATTHVDGAFSLVYLVFNTITNVTTQDEQVAVFENAAAHLEPGGCFVVEVGVPRLGRVAIAKQGHVFQMDPDHVGIETFDDTVGQISSSHHWMDVDGRMVRHSAPYRYVWPSELDLMARVAGLLVRERWADWAKSPFTADSTSQVAVFQKAA
jgi:SAM-dependent methyltransferase